MSSSNQVEAILNASTKYTISIYFVIFIGGFFGNISNVIVFGYLKVFRRNQFAFYIIVGSIADFLFLLVTSPLRIVQNISGYDPLQLSLAWCKIRNSIDPVFSLLSFSVICFAAIDQYISTHHNPWLRQLSTIKLAHRLVCSAVIIWILHAIPFLIYFNIQSSAGCAIYNAAFAVYYSIGNFCVLSGVLPNTVAGLFAALAYLNVRRIVRRQVPIARRRLDRQLTAMVLTRVIFLVVTTVPFVIDRIYIYNRTIDPKDSLRLAIEQLLFNITSSLFNINSAGTFYVLLWVSKRFRQQVKRAFVKLIREKLLYTVRSNNTIHPNQAAPASDAIDLELEP